MLIQKIDTATGKEYLGKVQSNEIDFELDKNYYHNQIIPLAVWSITHNLNKVPSVMVFDSTNREVKGQVVIVDNNTIEIHFKSAFGGKAYLN